ncbi:MAG: N-acetylmuramoyl-L-alanine amidase [Candidatus Micrarchaeota archaeon]|nr:N-acetylmuramoyl-L-alanine amidase [Candidatus Micrarchaeota archaeon]
MPLAQKEKLTPEERLKMLYSLEDKMLEMALTNEVALRKDVVNVALSIAKSVYGVSDVRALQGTLGVKQDGIFGRQTLTALFKKLHEDNKNDELVRLRKAVYPHLSEVALSAPLGLLEAYGVESVKGLQSKLGKDYLGKDLKKDGILGKRTLYAMLTEYPQAKGKLKIVNSYLLEENITGTREGEKPQYIILHHTDTKTREAAIRAMKENKTSAHYIVGRDGTIYAEVREELKAEHAAGWNQRSIGIEIVSPGDGTYTPEQYASLERLLRDICERHNIPYDNEHIIGHFEVNAKKYDPYGLDWKKLGLNEPPGVKGLVARKIKPKKRA